MEKTKQTMKKHSKILNERYAECNAGGPRKPNPEDNEWKYGYWRLNYENPRLDAERKRIAKLPIFKRPMNAMQWGKQK